MWYCDCPRDTLVGQRNGEDTAEWIYFSCFCPRSVYVKIYKADGRTALWYCDGPRDNEMAKTLQSGFSSCFSSCSVHVERYKADRRTAVLSTKHTGWTTKWRRHCRVDLCCLVSRDAQYM